MTEKDDSAEIVRLPGGEPESYDGPLGFDEAAFLREWEQADAEAVEVLWEALPELLAAVPPVAELRAAADQIRAGLADKGWPYEHIAKANGWDNTIPAGDVDLWVAATGSLVSMREESGLGPDTDSALLALEHGDWVGAVIGLLRAGVGAPADAADLLAYADACPEVEGETAEDDVSLVTSAYDTVLFAWEATGAVTEDRRLTALGWWGLPRALAQAWDHDFDAPPVES